MAAHEQRLATALGKHRDGELVAAEALYREILSQHPQHAPAHHYLGFLLLQTGRFADAAAQLKCAIGLDASRAEWHFNLGIAHFRLGELDASIDAYSAAIEIDPGRYFYWTNLGTVLEQQGQAARAEQCYLAATSIDPDCPDAYYLLSSLCLGQRRYPEARRYNDLGIIAAPSQGHSLIVIAQAYHGLGRVDEAISLFERRLADAPDDAVAAHLLLAYRGQNAPERCARSYVEQTFDGFAHSFDVILGRIGYSAPQWAQDYLAGLPVDDASLNALDLGCGTGLVGMRLARHVRSMTGVDLSAAMLEQAAQKQCYDRLCRADIAEFLATSAERYELIVCMDTFIYIGRLDELIALIHARLDAGGRFLFSTEKLEEPAAEGFRLNISGRYSHHQDYLTRLLALSGFEIEQRCDADIRNESGCPVRGQFYCAVRVR